MALLFCTHTKITLKGLVMERQAFQHVLSNSSSFYPLPRHKDTSLLGVCYSSILPLFQFCISLFGLLYTEQLIKTENSHILEASKSKIKGLAGCLLRACSESQMVPSPCPQKVRGDKQLSRVSFYKGIGPNHAEPS